MDRPGETDLVRTVWCAEVEEAGVYPVAGSEFWGISFARSAGGAVTAVMDGPTLRASQVDSVVGDRYWGVELAAHVAIAGAAKEAVLDRQIGLPVSEGRVEVAGRWWPIPDVEGLEAWVAGLVAAGALVDDPDIRAALAGDRVGATDRTWQRRFRRTVGLTAAQIAQLHRAQHAFVLLQGGMRPAEAAAAAGFSDQPHLTRALRMIRGQTPAAIIAAHARARFAEG